MYYFRLFYKDKMDILFKLTDSLSNQVKFANKIWITLAIVTILSIMPVSTSFQNGSSEMDTQLKLELPIVSWEMPVRDFYPFTLLILSLLIVGYGAAHIQTFNTRKLITHALKEIKINLKSVRSKDLIDCLVGSTFNRIGPIAQLFLGDSQFNKHVPKSSASKVSSSIIYAILKLTTLFVLYFLPIHGLVHSFKETIIILKHQELWLPNIVFLTFPLLALIVTMFTLVCDSLYGWKAFLNYTNE